MTTKIITVEVVKSHDGIQQGTILRFAEFPALQYMIANGYYKLLSTQDAAADSDATMSAKARPKEASVVDTVKKALRKSAKK